jgi:phosphonate transport system permease protein
MNTPTPANETYRLPPRLFDARCKACWFVFGLICLTIASFITLDLQFAKFFSADSMRKMGKFIAELLSPTADPLFLKKLAIASFETLAMSALGTLLAAVFGLLTEIARFGANRRVCCSTPCARFPNSCGPHCY